MRSALLPLLMLAALAPLPFGAAATCASAGAVEACVVDDSTSEGSCRDLGSRDDRTAVRVQAGTVGASASGASSCSNTGTTYQSRDEIRAEAWTSTQRVEVAWSRYVANDPSGSPVDVCSVSARTPALALGQPCPAGLAPPHAGWGSFLP